MIKKILYKLFGTRNDRLLKTYNRIVSKINSFESEIAKLSDSEIQQKTLEFKERYKGGETLASILPEAFAVCREASIRVLGMRHFDVQLIGGIVLNDGKIAEMKTGEGKTLVGTLSAYLNAITGNGVHVVTVNDYLARRDALEMSKLYNFLGLTVGINLPDMSSEEKRVAYASDITYGTNNEFGFDYLRDNMVFEDKEKVQRPLNFTIVDEVDSILIDEARTPLIISGPAEGSNDLYLKLDQVPKMLKRQSAEDSLDGDFWVDEKNNNVILSEAGHVKVEEILTSNGLLAEGDSLYNVNNISLMHHLLAAMKAHYVFIKDQSYVVQDDEVVIVDEFTGRLMSGRRWSDGLHQAVEAKEKVEIQKENQTMASITFQNYFRMYKKLSGMTGTADTEAYEFQQIYGLETVVIPTNNFMVRKDYNDQIYMNLDDKYQALVSDIIECNRLGQPVLVGTTSVEKSEVISSLLTRANLAHEVLNAKQHGREAEIIVQAGSAHAITVATNMAGRGTDIILGGNPKPEINAINDDDKLTEKQKELQIEQVMNKWRENNKRVLDAGGLYIIGTERHESRRIDNQLRGRSGRQGDAGVSRFYLSLDDSLLRIFGGERMRGMMQRLGMEKGESIEHKWLSRSIESAQRKVEGHNFDIRKQLLDYDDVSNDQRRVIYKQRDDILTGNDLSDITYGMINGVLNQVFDAHIPPKTMIEMWDVSGLEKILNDEFRVNIDIAKLIESDPKIHEEDIKELVLKQATDIYQNKMSSFAKRVEADIEKLASNMIPKDKSAWNLEALDMFCAGNGITLPESFVSYVANKSDIDSSKLLGYFKANTSDIGQRQVNRFERGILLQHIDYHWREHLTGLEQLRQGIHLRGYAQKDPKQEYKTESFNLFSGMLDNIKRDATRMLLTVQIQGLDDIPNEDIVSVENMITSHTKPVTTGEDLNRNALCYCGSRKKYKHCHGKLS